MQETDDAPDVEEAEESEPVVEAQSETEAAQMPATAVVTDLDEDSADTCVSSESLEEKVACPEAAVDNVVMKQQVVDLENKLGEAKRSSKLNIHSCSKWSDKKFNSFIGLPSFLRLKACASCLSQTCTK